MSSYTVYRHIQYTYCPKRTVTSPIGTEVDRSRISTIKKLTCNGPLVSLVLQYYTNLTFSTLNFCLKYAGTHLFLRLNLTCDTKVSRSLLIQSSNTTYQNMSSEGNVGCCWQFFCCLRYSKMWIYRSSERRPKAIYRVLQVDLGVTNELRLIESKLQSYKFLGDVIYCHLFTSLSMDVRL